MLQSDERAVLALLMRLPNETEAAMIQLPPLPADLAATVTAALQEDIGSGDITAQLIPADTWARGRVITRQAAVIAGIAWFDEVFRQVDDRVKIQWQVQDGSHAAPDQVLCSLQGPARALLTGERAALNFLQTLSATATRVAQMVELIAGTRAALLDTRKTIPGLRNAQKYAVRCGGGHNHRMGLYDAFLIKENHIAAASSISAAVQAARRIAPSSPVEIEVETLAQLQEALAAGVDRVLLDNFSPEQMREAAEQNAGRAKLEASGGIGPHNLRAVAETGVDYISLGTLTKDVQAVDLSMRLEPA
jgi:nicotinate-nucleotide pyrophosphorylase (carboxylating)